METESTTHLKTRLSKPIKEFTKQFRRVVRFIKNYLCPIKKKTKANV